MRPRDLAGMTRGDGRAGYSSALQHNDVKPKNIHVDPDGDRKSGVLLDYGLTRFASDSSIFGHTRQYADPTGSTTPGERDRFAFFATTYQTLLGTVPPLAGNLPDVPTMVANLRAAPLLDERPDALHALTAALESSAGGRPTSLVRWLDELDSATTVTKTLHQQQGRDTRRDLAVVRRPRRRGKVANVIRFVVVLLVLALLGIFAEIATGHGAAVASGVRTVRGLFTSDNTNADKSPENDSTNRSDTGASKTTTTTTMKTRTPSPKPSPTSPPPSPNPTITWRLGSLTADVGEKVRFSYTAGNVIAGRHVVLQSQQGTAGTWQSLATLPGTSRSATLTAPAMGRHTYRVVVTGATSGDVVGTPQTLTSYGTVPLKRLSEAAGGGYSEGTVSEGGRLFAYTVGGGNCDLICYDKKQTVIDAQGTTCRSLHLLVAIDQGDDGKGSPRLSIQQDNLDEVSRELTPNRVFTVDVPIRSRNFQVTWNEPSSEGVAVYFNGTANCYTPSGMIKPSNE